MIEPILFLPVIVVVAWLFKREPRSLRSSVHPLRSALCRFIGSVLPTNHLFGHGGP
jgi:hypothetical protein